MQHNPLKINFVKAAILLITFDNTKTQNTIN